MRTRKLGNSDLNITPVGFGAWAIGGAGYDFGWGPQEDADSIAAIHRALDLGVNWIDTAAVYGIGHSEEVVAKALSAWKGAWPYVFTKCAMRWDSQGRVTKIHKRDSILKECDDSLRRSGSMSLICTKSTGPPRTTAPTSKNPGKPWLT
jgi:aryl-alcohol dehydrogenase-like predicted oxidoreductase